MASRNSPPQTRSIFGAVGWPGVPDHISLLGLLLPIRQHFDQYACIRPTRLLPGITSPLRTVPSTGLDFVVVRENTEGEYANIGGNVLGGRGVEHAVALQTAIFTTAGCERIMRYAFDLARTRQRKKVTNVTKSNAQQYSMVFMEVNQDNCTLLEIQNSKRTIHAHYSR